MFTLSVAIHVQLNHCRTPACGKPVAVKSCKHLVTCIGSFCRAALPSTSWRVQSLTHELPGEAATYPKLGRASALQLLRGEHVDQAQIVNGLLSPTARESLSQPQDQLHQHKTLHVPQRVRTTTSLSHVRNAYFPSALEECRWSDLWPDLSQPPWSQHESGHEGLKPCSMPSQLEIQLALAEGSLQKDSWMRGHAGNSSVSQEDVASPPLPDASEESWHPTGPSLNHHGSRQPYCDEPQINNILPPSDSPNASGRKRRAVQGLQVDAGEVLGLTLHLLDTHEEQQRASRCRRVAYAENPDPAGQGMLGQACSLQKSGSFEKGPSLIDYSGVAMMNVSSTSEATSTCKGAGEKGWPCHGESDEGSRHRDEGQADSGGSEGEGSSHLRKVRRPDATIITLTTLERGGYFDMPIQVRHYQVLNPGDYLHLPSAHGAYEAVLIPPGERGLGVQAITTSGAHHGDGMSQLHQCKG